MSSNSQKKWIVKDPEGKIFGPFTTQQVLEQIDRNYFLGSETVASYPGGKWVPISSAPEFYDRLLDVLAAEVKVVIPPQNVASVAGSKMGSKMNSEQKTVTPQVTQQTQSVEIEVPHQTVTRTSVPEADSNTSAQQVIELLDLRKLEVSERLKTSRKPLVLAAAGIALLAIITFFSDEMGAGDDRIHLLAPRKGQGELSESRLQEKRRRALAAFQTDIFTGYVRAQNELVEMIEGAPQRAEAAQQRASMYSTLCLVYRELWPFAHQDSADMRALTMVAQEAKRLDPAGLNGALCEIVQLMINGKYKDAQGLTESVLLEQSTAPVLFEIRGDIYGYAKDSQNAIGYFNQARTLWPAWQKTAVQEARSRAELGQFPQAMQLYRGVLAAVPTHPVAKIELGVIEALQFSQFDKGLELIDSGIDGSERVSRQFKSIGYFGMARIFEKRNQKEKAAKHALLAYENDPSNQNAKKMAERLSGGIAGVNPKTPPRERVFLGDQYVRAGDCFSAQAEYKAAFEAEPKNGIAAMKAGKCLWELNQTLDAIDWMKKAIAADPNLIAAYVELASYYAHRYDFFVAVEVLKRAQQKSPRNFEIFRGFASLELRRQNYEGAKAYGERALQLYEADVDTFLIMSRAYLGMHKYQDAQRFAVKAIEIDFNNFEAQSLYGKIEAGLQGVDAGANYMNQLINRYVIKQGQQVPPAAIEYRITLGEILMQDDRFKEAEEVLRQAVSLDPNNRRALVNLGKALQAQNAHSVALEFYLKAAVLDPSDADPIYLSGQLYADVNKLAEATRQFERVLKINPRYPRAHVALGRVALRANDPKRALAEALAERQINPDLSDGYILAAESYFALGQYSNCAGEYQKAVSKRTQGASILVRMARCYRLAGALDSATSLLRQAQAIENGLADIYKEQGAIYHTRGMANEAVAAYDTYLRLMPNATDKNEIDSRIRKVQTGDLNVGP